MTPCQNKCLNSGHYHQGGSKPGLEWLNNLRIPTNHAICFSIFDGSGLSAETVLTQSDTLALSLLLSQLKYMRNAFHTYVYTLFTSNLVLAKSVVVGKAQSKL